MLQFLFVVRTRTLLHKKGKEANVKIGTKGRNLLEKKRKEGSDRSVRETFSGEKTTTTLLHAFLTH
jgi:hypothetical protein